MQQIRADDALLEAIAGVALAAGACILEIYRTDFGVAMKDDASPVTEADSAAEAIILAGLAKIAPSIPAISEEAAPGAAIAAPGDEFFLVDPLDGTKEFITRNGEFTVNIALIRATAPVLGAVYAPALGKLYLGRKGEGASLSASAAAGGTGGRRAIAARRAPDAGLVAIASRSHRSPETDAFLSTLNVAEFAAAGSSLKFCLIAEGSADVYPRLGRTMEWDTAAGQAVLEAAGGRVEIFGEGSPLRYGKAARGFDNPHFIAWGR